MALSAGNEHDARQMKQELIKQKESLHLQQQDSAADTDKDCETSKTVKSDIESPSSINILPVRTTKTLSTKVWIAVTVLSVCLIGLVVGVVGG